MAKNWFTKPGFWEGFVDFSEEKQQNTKFTKFSSVRTPEIYQISFFWIGPNPVSSDHPKSADRKMCQRKGAKSKSFKNHQKVSKIFSTIFDIFLAGQKASKFVKKCQKCFRHFSPIFAQHQFSGPFWGALTKENAQQIGRPQSTQRCRLSGTKTP